MNVSIVRVDGIEYLVQHDAENVFITRNQTNKRHVMLGIELVYGEVVNVKRVYNQQKVMEQLDVKKATRFGADAYAIARDYASEVLC